MLFYLRSLCLGPPFGCCIGGRIIYQFRLMILHHNFLLGEEFREQVEGLVPSLCQRNRVLRTSLFYRWSTSSTAGDLVLQHNMYARCLDGRPFPPSFKQVTS